MTSCCDGPRDPHVILAGVDRPTDAWRMQVPGTPTVCSALLKRPPVPPQTDFRDLRALIMHFGHRQEELLSQVVDQQKQMLDQQKEVENQLSMLKSESKFTGDEPDSIDAVNNFLNYAGTDEALEAARHVIANHAHRNMEKQTKRMTISSASSQFKEELKQQVASDNMRADQRRRSSAASTISGADLNSCSTSCVQFDDADNGAEAIKPSQSSRRSDEGGGNSGVSHVWKQLSGLKHRTSVLPEDQEAIPLMIRLNYALKSKEFEFAIALAIILHASIMSWEYQFQGLDVGFTMRYPGRNVEARVIWPWAQMAFKICDWIFGTLFLIEMVVKMVVWRFKYFYIPQHRTAEEESHAKSCDHCRWLWNVQGWNVLDFSSVLMFLFGKSLTIQGVNPQMLRLFRLFRLFRLIRLVRFLETLDHLYVMTTAIAGLSKVLTWAVVLLTLMLLICTLFLVQILQVIYFLDVEYSDLTDAALQKHQEMYMYFGTCTRCMLSMFEITMGNWPPVARLLAEEVSEWFALICIIHKITIGFAVIGVITGVILQETFKVAQTDDIIMLRQKKHQSQVLHNKLKALFTTLDNNPDGKIHMSEFATIGDDPDIQLWLGSLDIETDDLAALFELLDIDGSGYLTVDELVTRMPRVRGSARSIDVLKLLRKYFG